MNGTKELLINTGNVFKELPDRISLCFEIVDIAALQLPQGLFDPEAAPSAPGFSDAFLPVIVFPDHNKAFTVIDGCKRYRCLKNKGVQAISCGVISTPLNAFSSGLLRIILNKSGDRHIREKYFFLSWLKQHCAPESFEVYAQTSGFSQKDINQLIPVLSCEPEIIHALFEERLDISLVKNILCLSAEDRICYLNTFKNLKLSLQTQKEFLDWLPEIAYTENKTVRELLSEPQITEIACSNSLNPPQKIEKIRSVIYTRKFPRLSKTQNIWKNRARALNPDSACVSFEPDPFFEKNRLEIKTVINDPDKAVYVFNKLSKITSEEWDGLIYPLKSQ